MLLSAYRQGIFPWYNPGERILWWSPDPRFVVFFDELHVSRSTARVMRNASFDVSIDRDFPGVISRCATTPRPAQHGTWITADMREAYCDLHHLGYAHSCEVWQNDLLVGGVYGVALGRIFFGESMFSRVPNASKIALIRLCGFLEAAGYHLLDAQLRTAHVERMGGREISRDNFLQRLERALRYPTEQGSWSQRFSSESHCRR